MCACACRLTLCVKSKQKLHTLTSPIIVCVCVKHTVHLVGYRCQRPSLSHVIRESVASIILYASSHVPRFLHININKLYTAYNTQYSFVIILHSQLDPKVKKARLIFHLIIVTIYILYNIVCTLLYGTYIQHNHIGGVQSKQFVTVLDKITGHRCDAESITTAWCNIFNLW